MSSPLDKLPQLDRIEVLVKAVLCSGRGHAWGKDKWNGLSAFEAACEESPGYMEQLRGPGRGLDPWDNNTIQFPRLLAEIRGVDLTPKQISSLCESMDLDANEIEQLFERAELEWQRIKAEL